MDERVVYPGQADLAAALEAAGARYRATSEREAIERSKAEEARRQAERERVERERERERRIAQEAQAQREALAKQKAAQEQREREAIERSKAEEARRQAEKEIKEREQRMAQAAHAQREAEAKRKNEQLHRENLKQDRAAELEALHQKYLKVEQSNFQFSLVFFLGLALVSAGAWKLWGEHQWVNWIGTAVFVFSGLGSFETWSSYTAAKTSTPLSTYRKFMAANPNGALAGSQADQYINGFHTIQKKYWSSLGPIED